MNVVCPGIKQIHTIYQHFVILVFSYTHNLHLFLHLQFLFYAHERILAGYQVDALI